MRRERDYNSTRRKSVTVVNLGLPLQLFVYRQTKKAQAMFSNLVYWPGHETSIQRQLSFLVFLPSRHQHAVCFRLIQCHQICTAQRIWNNIENLLSTQLSSYNNNNNNEILIKSEPLVLPELGALNRKKTQKTSALYGDTFQQYSNYRTYIHSNKNKNGIIVPTFSLHLTFNFVQLQQSLHQTYLQKLTPTRCNQTT